jgi:hypothetical protein
MPWEWWPTFTSDPDTMDVIRTQQCFQAFPNSNVSKSGKIVCLETSGIPILDEVGRLSGYRGAHTDVTELYRAEAEAQLLREELAHFSRVATMNVLTASIVHELNQPLTAIPANVQAAMPLIHGNAPDPKELREILEEQHWLFTEQLKDGTDKLPFCLQIPLGWSRWDC